MADFVLQQRLTATTQCFPLKCLPNTAFLLGYCKIILPHYCNKNINCFTNMDTAFVHSKDSPS